MNLFNFIWHGGQKIIHARRQNKNVGIRKVREFKIWTCIKIDVVNLSKLVDIKYLLKMYSWELCIFMMD